MNFQLFTLMFLWTLSLKKWLLLEAYVLNTCVQGSHSVCDLKPTIALVHIRLPQQNEEF